MIDWNAFTPGSALIGGALIGMAAGLFILLLGRIAGVSGIVGGLLRRSVDDTTWRLAFVLGLVLAPLLWLRWVGQVPVTITAGTPMLIFAGLLVGFGTRLGSGCTSGHGVCGLARASSRSLVAVAIFTATGFVTVYLLRHVLAN